MTPISTPPLSISYAQPTDEDKERLALQYTDAVRVVQSQIAGGEGLDRKTEHLVYVGLLGLAAAFTLASYASASESIPALAKRASFLLVLAGAGINIAGLLIAAHAYAGLGKRTPTRADSPNVRDLSNEANTPKYPPWKYHTSVIHGLAVAFEENDREAARNVRLRTQALWCLIGAALIYAAAAAVISGALAWGG